MLKPNKHNFERITKAVEHEFEWELIEKPKIAVQDLDSDTGESHVVNAKSLLCSCNDFEYNCKEGEYCKHLFHLVFRAGNMLEK